MPILRLRIDWANANDHSKGLDRMAYTRDQIGHKLLMLRTDLRMTQEAVAAAIGMAPATISQYENGAMVPNAESIVKLAEFFGVTPNDILCWKKE